MRAARTRSHWVDRVLSLSPAAKTAVVMLVDGFICFGALFAALSLTGGISREFLMEDFLLALMAAATVVGILRAFDAYRVVIRFIDHALTVRLIQGYAVATLVLYGASLWFGIPARVSVFAVFFILGPTLAMQARLFAQHLLQVENGEDRRTPVIIYGAGHAGTQLAAALRTSALYRVRAFVDDRAALQGRQIRGLTVFAPSELRSLRDRGWCEQIFLAIPSISKSRRRQVLEMLEELAVKVQVVPGLDEMASGNRKLEETREVQVEDLLGRDPVEPIKGLAESHVKDQCVLVTGAGGSIGSELCRQLAGLGVAKLVLFEMCEYNLYAIERELRPVAERKGFHLVPVLGSVTDEIALGRTIREHGANTLYHAAAYKHVPLVEGNVVSAIRNNVLGTLFACRASVQNQVRNFILISTDKAVRPTSVMGASKRLCELVIQAYAEAHPQIRMCMVRFGNVLASSGSVVPLFTEQIHRGGPITVTHPEVTRYFMTIPEAAQLVLQAGAMGRSGEVFVLDMGKPVKIREMAERMVHLSGLQLKTQDCPHGDIELQYTGLRPGEKLYEELLVKDAPIPTAHPRIFQAHEQYIRLPSLEQHLRRLTEFVNDNAERRIRDELRLLVEGFGGQAIDIPLAHRVPSAGAVGPGGPGKLAELSPARSSVFAKESELARAH